MSNILYKRFSEVNLRDDFFDSLREDYLEFDAWYRKKEREGASAFVLYENEKLVCFVYLKIEDDSALDEEIFPSLSFKRWLKVGTFKIVARHTKLGERLIKRMFDFAISHNIFDLYVTAFAKHELLINILKRYGFEEYGHKKDEIVLTKHIISNFDYPKFSSVCILDKCPPLSYNFSDLPISSRNIVKRSRSDQDFKRCYRECSILKDQFYSINIDNPSPSSIFPTVWARKVKKCILGIYPKYHTRMFPDSKLHTESTSLLCDISETNSIHKVYLSKMYEFPMLEKGDLLIIYRTKDDDAHSAHYSSVATSLCVVEEYKNIKSFKDEEEFIKYCKPHNIFSDVELKNFYEKKRYPHLIKMTYNVAFKKRVVLSKLREILGDTEKYWGFVRLDDKQFRDIIYEGQVDDSIIIY